MSKLDSTPSRFRVNDQQTSKIRWLLTYTTLSQSTIATRMGLSDFHVSKINREFNIRVVRLRDGTTIEARNAPVEVDE